MSESKPKLRLWQKKSPVKASDLAGLIRKWRCRGGALLRNVSALIIKHALLVNNRHMIKTCIKKIPVKASDLAGHIRKWRCRESNPGPGR